VLQTIAVVGQSGKPVTGLPNIEGRDDAPYDYSGQTRLAFSPSGIDSEGLVRTSTGEFWVAFDIASERMTAEYVYRLEPAADFFPGAVPRDMKLSALVALSPTTLLILERTDDVARLYSVDLSAASNILGSSWDDESMQPTLEGLEAPESLGIAVLPKSLQVDLATMPGVPRKIEGLAVLDQSSVAIANDNDFDFVSFDAEGNAELGGVRCQLLVLKLVSALPSR
jgi:hypothetical protein